MPRINNNSIKINQELVNQFILAAQNDNLQEVQKIIDDHPAIINKINNRGFSALMLAGGFNNTNMAAYLIEKGASREYMQNPANRQSALTFAVRYCNIKTAQILIKGLENLDITDGNNKTALMSAIEENNLNVASFLISQGANINFHGKGNFTALMCAIDLNKHQDDDIKKVGFLLNEGADVNISDDNGHTALTYAIRKGNNDIVFLLISRGAKIDNIAREYLNNLTGVELKKAQEAIEVGKKVMSLGLDEKLAENQPGYSTKTLFEYAKSEEQKMSQEDATDILWKEILKNNPSKELIKTSISNGADVNFRKGKNGITPLYKATSIGRLDIVELLLENGAKSSINIKHKKTKFTPLHIGVKKGFSNIVECFLSIEGIDINSKAAGKTALDIARENNKEALIKILESSLKDQKSVEEHDLEPGAIDHDEQPGLEIRDGEATAVRKLNSQHELL